MHDNKGKHWIIVPGYDTQAVTKSDGWERFWPRFCSRAWTACSASKHRRHGAWAANTSFSAPLCRSKLALSTLSHRIYDLVLVTQCPRCPNCRKNRLGAGTSGVQRSRPTRYEYYTPSLVAQKQHQTCTVRGPLEQGHHHMRTHTSRVDG